jgi:hypothetical protein
MVFDLKFDWINFVSRLQKNVVFMNKNGQHVYSEIIIFQNSISHNTIQQRNVLERFGIKKYSRNG